MKNKFQNIFLTIAIFIANIIIAQPNPDPDGTDGNPTDAPIDSYWALLAIAGVVFCYIQFRKKFKAA